ncbi:hypothetical protein [Acinetobacter phage vB_AbaS_TCUP2199]|nr:hypothetical protein [Acinetobacter phage vB_AbaS_TCUP2199]
MTPEDQKVLDQIVDLPTVLNVEGFGITEADVYNQACQIYAKLVSVPRTLQHEQMLDFTYKELGYEGGATEAYQVGAVQAAFNIKRMVEKGMAKQEKENV